MMLRVLPTMSIITIRKPNKGEFIATSRASRASTRNSAKASRRLWRGVNRPATGLFLASSPPIVFSVRPFHATAALFPGICFSKPGCPRDHPPAHIQRLSLDILPGARSLRPERASWSIVPRGKCREVRLGAAAHTSLMCGSAQGRTYTGRKRRDPSVVKSRRATELRTPVLSGQWHPSIRPIAAPAS